MKLLEARVFKLKSNADLQRMIAAYSNYLSGARFSEILQLFANEQDDVRVATPWGIYEGYDSIGRLYYGLYRHILCGDCANGVLPGVLDVHGVNTPVISIAGDGLTAKAMFCSPGLFTVRKEGTPNNLQSYWCWQKIGCDFIYENDNWKIWHLHFFPLFTAEFERSWVDAQENIYSAEIINRYAPDRPSTDAVPIPPEPYQTFTETWSY